MGPSIADGQMTARIQAGDEDAAAYVYLQYVDRLVSLARARLHNRVRAKIDAEDIVQSVFKTFFRRTVDGRIEITSAASLWGLLARITVRKCRREAVNYHSARRNVDREQVLPIEDCELATSREPCPVEQTILAETLDDLLQSLDARQREIVEMALLGHSKEQISRRIGRTERTIERVLSFVRQRLSRAED